MRITQLEQSLEDAYMALQAEGHDVENQIEDLVERLQEIEKEKLAMEILYRDWFVPGSQRRRTKRE